MKGAAGYVIYRRAWSSTTNGWTTFERWNNTTGLSFTDTKVYAGTIYQYGIKAYYGSDPKNMAYVGPVGPLSTMVRITKRTITSAVSSGNNAITVKWDASGLFTGYQVQYSNDAAFASKQTVTIGNKAKVSTAVTINQAGDFYLRVRSYTVNNGNTYYGPWSETAIVSVNSAPVATASKVKYDCNKISFTNVPGASGYAIYRSTSENGKYTMLGTSSSSPYTDSTAQAGTTYYYKVAAYGYDENGNTSYGLMSYAEEITTALKPSFSGYLETHYDQYSRYCYLHIDNDGPKDLYVGGSSVSGFAHVYPYQDASYTKAYYYVNGTRYNTIHWDPYSSGYVMVRLESERYFTDGAHIVFFFTYDDCSYTAVIKDDGSGIFS